MTWDLTKLYSDFDDPRYAADIESMRALAGELLERAKTMELSRATLEAFIEDLKRFASLATRTASFAELTLAADADNEAATAAFDRLMPILNVADLVDSALSARLADADIAALTAGSPLLTEHAYMLRKMKENARHVIDPALEPTVLQMQLTGGVAWSQLRDQLDAGLMIDFEEDGEVKRLPLSAIRGKAYSADGEVRRRAYEAELAAYPRMEVPMAACLNGIKGEALTLCELKHFDSVLDMSLDIANMDRATLDALM